jgi:nitric oxide reductase subunit C
LAERISPRAERRPSAVGPALDVVGSLRDAAFIAGWLRDPYAAKPDSKMPKLPLTEGQIDELVAFLSQQNET